MWKYQKSGLYIHIPFCHHKCAYCDFFSITEFGNLDNFLDALQKEISVYANDWQHHSFDTIYFGGGTPSILSPDSIDFIISELKKNYNITLDAEITLEANPGTLDMDRIAGLMKADINRISLGVQSFNEKELSFLDRIHDVKDVFESFGDLRKAGFDNISIDLISSIPGQQKDSLTKNINEAMLLNPEHISVYTLIVEPNTPFGKLKKQGRLETVSEDIENELYLHTADTLEANGYEWYEVSSFARSADLQSRHNNKYWNLVPYLGLGPSAHSFDGKSRWANPRSITNYIEPLLGDKLPETKIEHLSRETKMLEFAFLGFRQKCGLDKIRFSKLFDCEFDDVFESFLSKFNGTEWLINDGDNIRLSRQGLPLCDEIATYLEVGQKCVTS